MHYPLAFQMPGLAEWIVIGAIGLLLFGKRLPEVGRNIGKSIVEFKKGLKEAEQSMNEPEQILPAPPPQAALPQSYKFDPYTGKPLNEPAQSTPIQNPPPANT